ncbi:DUF3108 domain-containing protein [Marinobacterium rhizophilum]|uniref:DUF3108 domain-containing protein n=1 Tax=Marinobacterium rhizophilum TaxID=420402 RepID=A0ABY5HGS5_9GAMM|nr:DUF3108 domain-containing protein [Marinobacterium rhizophilum]UTW11319.1 DUF3108 domain-containing protein [Marinobacterium rhizophilum]
MYKRLAPLLLFTLLFAGSAQAAEPLLNTRYSAQYKGFDLTLERTLKPLGTNRYQFESRARGAIARIEESSTFRRDSSGRWIPQLYRYNQSVLGISRQYELRFNEAGDSVIFADKKGQRAISIAPGTLDPLLYQLKLQQDLARQSGDYHYRFVSRSKLKDYRFEIDGRETLQLGGQPLDNLRLRKRDSDPSQETLLWFSPDNGYQLMRLRHTEDGDSYSISLKSLQQSPAFRQWLR